MGRMSCSLHFNRLKTSSLFPCPPSHLTSTHPFHPSSTAIQQCFQDASHRFVSLLCLPMCPIILDLAGPWDGCGGGCVCACVAVSRDWAEDGLRTLVFAYKPLTRAEVDAFLEEFNRAQADLVERQKKEAKKPNRIDDVRVQRSLAEQEPRGC